MTCGSMWLIGALVLTPLFAGMLIGAALYAWGHAAGARHGPLWWWEQRRDGGDPATADQVRRYLERRHDE